MKNVRKLALIIVIGVVISLGTVNAVTVQKMSESSPKTTDQTDVQPSSAFEPGTKFVQEGLKTTDQTFIFDSQRVDANGDGTLDDVVLYGEREDDFSPVQNIKVAVKDGLTDKFSATPIVDYGFMPKLFIGSFTNTKNNDIFVSIATGGSGGVSQFSLMSYKDGQITLIVPQKELNDGLALETQCLPGFILKVSDKNTGYIATIDLNKGSTDYQSLGIYNEKGELLKDPFVLIDGYGLLNPEDDNKDGIYELHGIQMISVGAHVNGVANAKSVWTVSNGQLKLLSETIEAYN
ncbi:hypothetical protein [Desulfosporosinus sp. OT]|uniref:hypothetical protein n=1 Tax=Desulfosporosinus sp. OT TaxID=913865 RepID=UPI001A98985C|nr:hypothetical protein [Desulfosporosinus sp. OT]